jgi:pyruvate dehydrogenase E2 component (dihydrolipoamide acetyltransferase)
VDAVTAVLVPDLGDAADVAVIEIHVKPGDAIRVDDPIVTLESDKASMDVPSTVAGIVAKVVVEVGAIVAEGTPLIEVATTDGESPDEPPETAETETAQEPVSPAEPIADGVAPEPATDAAATPAAGQTAAVASFPAAAQTTEPEVAPEDDGIHASPLARRLARELGVELAGVSGTARGGRISKEDVLARASAAATSPAEATTGAVTATTTAPTASTDPFAGLAPWPQVDFARFGEIEVVKLSRIRKLIGANLHRNWVRIPHVTHHDEADVTELEAFRVRSNEERSGTGAKLTMVALLLKASVAALRAHPEFNASLEGDSLVLKRYYHLGVAVDTENGLVVPVVRDVDRKGLLEIAADLADLSGRARDGKLSLDDMQGSTFTISSLGGIGGTGFTPIVNAPEVAILGVTRTATRPVWDGAAFAPRLVLPLSLSYDHRVIDGAAAARFTRTLAGALEDLRRLLL